MSSLVSTLTDPASKIKRAPKPFMLARPLGRMTHGKTQNENTADAVTRQSKMF